LHQHNQFDLAMLTARTYFPTMQTRYFLPTLVVLFASTTTFAVEPSDLKPGLVAAYLEPHKGPPPPAVTRLEPTVALTLNKGESPHPKLAGLMSAKWTGYVNITRPGKYTFSANVLNGTLRVSIAGKSVLVAPASGESVSEVRADTVQLDGGVQSFEATFGTSGAPCRVELFWQGPGFVKEPLPHQFLGHLPKDQPSGFTKDVELELGRLTFEEHGCINCHRAKSTDKMAKGLAERMGPNLTEIGKRVYPGWIDSWLANPTFHRPHTTMPKLFTDDERGQAERYAVTKYLLSLSGTPTLEPYKPSFNPPDGVRQSFERGRILYSVAGCAACHEIPKPKPKGAEEDEREPLKPHEFINGLGTQAGAAAKYSLGSLGSKTRAEALAVYLQNPLKTNPTGRMPNMSLSQNEATDIARYLCRLTDEVTEPGMPPLPKMKSWALGKAVYEDHYGLKARDAIAALSDLTAEKQWIEIGRTLTDVKGCLNCHVIEANGKRRMPLDAFPVLADIKAAGAKGCIGEKPDSAKVPVYKLDATETTALAAFLKDGLTGAGSPAPTHAARTALRRFNCLNCHSRDGEGGIPTELANSMRLLEKAENADDVRPPLLTGIGHKTRTAWLKSVLLGGGRARPWMQLRMPQYGEANVGILPEAFASLEGITPDDTIVKVPLSNEKIALGKQIIGKGGLGCISCHDIGGVANTGTRGPDLATINQRVRYDWYDRWMHQPLRMAPGTRMPQAFVDGKSTLSTVLKGDPKAQAEAMWAYLSLGPGLPLPEGLEPPKGLIIAVKDRPELLRTFMPEAGSKAIAVGYPGGVNAAFAADQCRLAYSWAGNFLDASPVWNNRGGAPAKLLGPKFWTAPAGHPWGLTVSASIPPDFLARANNPAFGMPLPQEPARIYDGPLAVSFDGYTLDKDGRPTFRYHLIENARDALLRVSETVVPLKASVATGFTRQFAIEAPAGYRAWFLAGQANKEPRVVSTGEAKSPTLDLKAPEPMVTANGTRVVLPQDADRAVLLEAPGAPEGSMWRFVPKSGGGWLVVLRLPEMKEPWKGKFEVVVWALPKDDDALLKGLVAK
jgi:cytochrome c553